MENGHPHELLVVLFVAALAPLLRELPLRLRMPLVVLELVFGFAVGPQGLDLVANEGGLRTLSALGLSFLFFLAGIEIDFHRLRGHPLVLGVVGWALSLALALAIAFGLRAAGIVSDPALVAIVLATTAIGTLLPVLREAGDLDSRFGRFVLGAGAIGEFGPIVLLSILITADGQGIAIRTGVMASFLAITLACAAIALRVHPPRAIEVFSRTLRTTSQLPVRLSMLLLGALVVLADVLDLDLLLGAFAAGSLIGLVSRGHDAEVFRQRAYPTPSALSRA